MYVYVRGGKCRCLWKPGKNPGLVEPELQAVVRHPTWVLGIRLSSGARAASPKCCAISLPRHSFPQKPQHQRNEGIFLSFHSYKRNLLRWIFGESVLRNLGGSMRSTTKVHKMNSSLPIIWRFCSCYFKVFLSDLDTPFILSAPTSIMSFSFPILKKKSQWLCTACG